MGTPLLQISMLAPGSLRRRDEMFSGWIPLLVGAALPAGLVACLRGAGCTIVARPSTRLPLCGLRAYLWRTSGVPLAPHEPALAGCQLVGTSRSFHNQTSRLSKFSRQIFTHSTPWIITRSQDVFFYAATPESFVSSTQSCDSTAECAALLGVAVLAGAATCSAGHLLQSCLPIGWLRVSSSWVPSLERSSV